MSEFYDVGQYLVKNPPLQEKLSAIWIPIGNPGYLGAKKQDNRRVLDEQFGAGNWRYSHYVRGRIVPMQEAILEYEESYRQHLHHHPDLVDLLVTECGNVYDCSPTNVYDDSYVQPETERNHYQDIAIRRVIAELAGDESWPQVVETEQEIAALIDFSDGSLHRLPRAQGFRGDHLLEIRGPTSAGFFLNPAVVPVHDPTLLAPRPNLQEWFLDEGCGHLSVEAFWQFSKTVEVRYDRFLALAQKRSEPLTRLLQD